MVPALTPRAFLQFAPHRCQEPRWKTLQKPCTSSDRTDAGTFSSWCWCWCWSCWSWCCCGSKPPKMAASSAAQPLQSVAKARSVRAARTSAKRLRLQLG